MKKKKIYNAPVFNILGDMKQLTKNKNATGSDSTNQCYRQNINDGSPLQGSNCP